MLTPSFAATLPLTAAELTPQQVRVIAESAGLDAQVCERLVRTAAERSPGDASIVAQLFAGFMFVGGRWVAPTLADLVAVEDRSTALREQIEREERAADKIRAHLHLSAECQRKAAIVAAGPPPPAPAPQSPATPEPPATPAAAPLGPPATPAAASEPVDDLISNEPNARSLDEAAAKLAADNAPYVDPPPETIKQGG